VQSSPGEGTHFSLYFPVAERMTPQIHDSSAIQTAEDGDGRATILVADDEAALRHALVDILRTSGYEVLEAQSATKALEIAEQHSGRLDILLTDIVMPGLRGTELARRVTKIHPSIQVVYMSGYAEGFSQTELPPNSVFLQKPFRFATLLEQLKLFRRRA